MPPVIASRFETRASGRNFISVPNANASTAMPIENCSRLPITTYGDAPHSQRPMKVIAVSSTSDTISRNATPSTSPNEISRIRTRPSTDDARAPVAGQITLSAVFSDANVADAPSASIANEIRAAVPPRLPLRCAFSTIVCTPAAASLPISSCTWLNTSPRAASAPKNQPATAITITSVGASENAE
ncbi:Uncharacterised protein [Burkholderia pseudomallei]|nr:Uncharacterised protein [Burkholderia pseudomallei]CAJ4565797.1 Uncharacterised protein [Burkholderia pseudomallei]CAJ4765881.1 Uncharacterised protein [Burkholderia pseudomallei]CAJ5182204.1 Uncharacterised protein [Burkholderia pseudomallei]CAJ5194824.1 Uncharacterised protein [Burkholderia pseudomallei]